MIRLIRYDETSKDEIVYRYIFNRNCSKECKYLFKTELCTLLTSLAKRETILISNICATKIKNCSSNVLNSCQVNNS